MKFTISSGALQKQLNLAGGAITGSPVVPILENFLFTVKDSVLEIKATDLETSITTKTEINSTENFSVAVPAKLLIDTLKQLPDQPISIEVDTSFSIQITSSSGKYKLAGADPSDYPTLPEPNEADQFTIPVNQLERAVNKTLFATSTDELRPAMMGVLFEIDRNTANFVSTDAHKLVKFTVNNLESTTSGNYIISRKALTLVKNALNNVSEVSISLDKKNAFFTIGNTLITCLLINANFPDYNNVIPTENPRILTVDRGDFLSKLKLIVIYANRTTNQVQLDLSHGSLTLQGKDADFGNEGIEQLACTFEGEPLKIAFNAKFLIEMLNAIQSEEITMRFSEPNRAAIMLPNEEEENESTLMLVMPVMINY